jgi:hypothetical protein
MLEGMAEGWEKLPNLPTESLSRESFYEDRLDGRDAVPPRCREAIGAFLQRIPHAGLFLEAKERSRCDREGDILRGIAKLAVASKNGFDSGDYERIIVVVRLDPPEKDVAKPGSA